MKELFSITTLIGNDLLAQFLGKIETKLEQSLVKIWTSFSDIWAN